MGEGLKTHLKNKLFYEILQRTSELVGSCEHGYEPSGSIKGGEYLD
jgi:hypothetical protein